MIAFDNTAGDFVYTWIDNASTMIAVARGHRDGNTLTTYNEVLDPRSRQLVKRRGVLRVVDPDHHVFQGFLTMPGGQEFRLMETEYVRQGKQ